MLHLAATEAVAFIGCAGIRVHRRPHHGQSNPTATARVNHPDVAALQSVRDDAFREEARGILVEQSTWQLGRRPALDGIRAIAVLLVMFGHFGVPGMYASPGEGVTIFFVLSGFLITTLLLEERARSGRIDLLAFTASSSTTPASPSRAPGVLSSDRVGAESI